ncbi:fluoride efflux transporter CrcB [Aquicoccus sp.]|uniref:fluoride efflux transporter CrcB n=1 Tax=Aquicoccus sp. TaxID=2055851 RepID=UPI003566834F
MFTTLLQVALGGAIGASLRYLSFAGAARLMGSGYPWGTLVVNVVGSLLMGVLFVTLASKDAMRLAPFLMTGILGGFTTFSAFSLDVYVLWEKEQAGFAALYVAVSVLLSVGALVLGIFVARGALQ